MALVDTLRQAVAGIRQTLKVGGLVVTVQRRPYAGPGTSGRDNYGALVSVPDVLLEDVDAEVVRFEGVDNSVRAKLTIFDPALLVSRKDRFVLPDGREFGVKLVKPGVVPTDGARITTEVMLG